MAEIGGPFDAAPLERGHKVDSESLVAELRTRLEATDAEMKARLIDIYDPSTGRIFSSSSFVVMPGRITLQHETGAYIQFNDETDGIAGLVGVAGHVVSGAAVDRLGLAGTAGIEFSGDGGTTRHVILASSGNLAITTANAQALTLSPGSTGAAQGVQLNVGGLANGSNGVLFNAPSGWTGNFWSANLNGVQQARLEQDGDFATIGDIIIAAAKRFYLDGGSNTYLIESSADQIDAVVGGNTRFKIGSVVEVQGAAFCIGAAQKLFLDGGGDTYIWEQQANVIQIVANGIVMASFNGAGDISIAAQGTGDVNISAPDDVNLDAPSGEVRLTSALVYLNGPVRFGTHTALGAETVTGYITITDSGGTTRKLAVVS